MTEQESSSGVLKWILGGGLGLAALVGAYVWAVAKEFLPSPAQLARRIRGEFVEPATGTHFTILLTELDGDTDGSQTKHVAAAFRGQEGIEVVRSLKPLKINPYRAQSEAEIQARRTGQQWLQDHNADLLIWGEVVQADVSLRLWFLQAGGDGAIGKTAYSLQDAVLPKDFDEDFATELIALALASVAPATKQAGTYLVELLKPAAEKLQRLSAHPPPYLSSDQRGRLQNAFGVAAATIGGQSAEDTWLKKAVSAFDSAMKEHTRARVPLDWATTQNNLGTALTALGEREAGTARLEEAVAAYSAALEEHIRERVPLQWAMTQNNLGNVLAILGEREAGTACLEEAVVAFRSALEVFKASNAEYYVNATESNLASAEAELAKRRGTDSDD